MTVKLYADDIVGYFAGKTKAIVETVINEEMGDFAVWSGEKRMTVNVPKTDYMWVGEKALLELESMGIKLNDENLKEVEHFKYLGVVLDQELTREKHVDHIVKQVNYKLFRLAKMRSCLDQQAAIMIYTGVIRPTLEYCGFVTAGAGKKQVERLQKLQNKALRICLKRKVWEQSTDELHQMAGVEKVDRRLDQLLLTHIHTRQDELQANNEQERSITTRSTGNLSFPVKRVFKKESYRDSPWYRAKVLWEALPEKVRKIESKEGFKNELRKIENFREGQKKGYN